MPPRPVRGEIGEQHAQGGPGDAGPLDHLVTTVLADQVPQRTGDRRIRQAVTAERHALTPDHLRLPVAQRAEQVAGERLDDRRLPRSGVAADDHKATAVGDDVVEDLVQPARIASARPTM